MLGTVDDITETLAAFGDDELIPLRDVGDAVGLKRGMQDYAVKRSIIVPAETRGPNGRYLVTRDEALLILASAALAVAIGVALVTVIKNLRNSGATMTPDGLLLPVKGLR